MWRRLPTWFPNIRLQMLPLTSEQKATLLDTGWLREVAFKCEPRVNKLEIKAFLEAVHGMKVERVNTINYQGKKKKDVDSNGRPHYYRRSDWKKAYVLFEPPDDIKQQWLEERGRQQQERLEQLKQAALQRQRLPNFLPAAAAAVAKDAAPAVTAAAAALTANRRARRAAEQEKEAAARKARSSSSSSRSSSRSKKPGQRGRS